MEDVPACSSRGTGRETCLRNSGSVRYVGAVEGDDDSGAAGILGPGDTDVQDVRASGQGWTGPDQHVTRFGGAVQVHVDCRAAVDGHRRDAMPRPGHGVVRDFRAREGQAYRIVDSAVPTLAGIVEHRRGWFIASRTVRPTTAHVVE